MRQWSILLAEDNDDLRVLYSYMFAAAGYRIRAVKNGLEALAEIQVECPDVIVTDIAMPVISGIDLIKAIRADSEYANIPVVAITSFGENLRELARIAGANISVDKPTECGRLRELVHSVLPCNY
jgi:CheY-like chemotaxis protein